MDKCKICGALDGMPHDITAHSATAAIAVTMPAPKVSNGK